MADKNEKLKILLEHLIKHNTDHALEIKEMAATAEELGFGDAGKLLVQGSNEMNLSNDTLKKALDLIVKGM
ncbi:hypothetical protein J0B03_03150 [Alkalibacter rhizosphaerae]|uniref:DUF8180 domain-containing protein n=1 Tax=Alkalibacter rhizosphaerae TaxID=2815577 RepID=A0A974XI32_9FIRM|nr:hypothetical protein [Alkalibacter rhizosphaerae]QSX09080.1 hypothetical protein J0B03_03150 [Alkalibacter rhizosphaerae]